MELNQHFLRLFFTIFDTVATRGIGTRNRPTSPLQLGVTDPEQILKTTRKIRRSQSLPALCDPNQLGGSLHSAETSPWIKPTIPESYFQVFTNPQSFLKAKTASPGKIPLFQLKLGKSLFNHLLAKPLHLQN